MQPITTSDIAGFVQLVIDCFDDSIFYAMTAMFAGAVALIVKRIMLE
jgi:hypothetical protein